MLQMFLDHCPCSKCCVCPESSLLGLEKSTGWNREQQAQADDGLWDWMGGGHIKGSSQVLTQIEEEVLQIEGRRCNTARLGRYSSLCADLSFGLGSCGLA